MTFAENNNPSVKELDWAQKCVEKNTAIYTPGEGSVSEVASLLIDLRQVGVALRVEAGRLRFAAPAGAMTEALLARLKASKAQVEVWVRYGTLTRRQEAQEMLRTESAV